jgi:hypothetical protein
MQDFAPHEMYGLSQNFVFAIANISFKFIRMLLKLRGANSVVGNNDGVTENIPNCCML